MNTANFDLQFTWFSSNYPFKFRKLANISLSQDRFHPHAFQLFVTPTWSELWTVSLNKQHTKIKVSGRRGVVLKRPLRVKRPFALICLPVLQSARLGTRYMRVGAGRSDGVKSRE
jgi:hypothetical protein